MKDPVDNEVIRSHMPYTYMPFLLCGLPDEVVDTYVVEVQKDAGRIGRWTMYVGKAYRLPLTVSGLFSWGSSDAEYADVDERGMLVAKGAGEAILTLTTPRGDQLQAKVRVLDA